jgi:hypothetical protein
MLHEFITVAIGEIPEQQLLRIKYVSKRPT